MRYITIIVLFACTVWAEDTTKEVKLSRNAERAYAFMRGLADL